MTRMRITASRGWRDFSARELFAYRELLYFFVWRYIKVRYRQTVQGAAWAVIQPLFYIAILSSFFGRLAGIEVATPGAQIALQNALCRSVNQTMSCVQCYSSFCPDDASL